MKISIDREELKGFLAYGAICFFWGTNFLAMPIGVADFPPLSFGGIRFAIAGLLMIVYVYLKGLKFPSSRKEINSLISHSSYLYLLQKWSAVKAGTYAYVNPVVAVIFGAAVLDEPVTPEIIVSSVVILSGVMPVQLSKTKTAIKAENTSIAGRCVDEI